MFFRKKAEAPPTNTGAPPPWVNIDETSKKKISVGRFRFNLFEFTKQVTGFGIWGTRFFLLGFAIAIGFLAWIIYDAREQGPALPVDVNRPAMDARATSTPFAAPSNQP